MPTLKANILLLICVLLLDTVQAEQKPFAPEYIQDVPIVTAEEVVEMILSTPNLIVIDSRKRAEYRKGHIEGAINMLNTKLQEDELRQLAPDKNTPILFYCNGIRCLRSSDSINKARAWGYTHLFWFRGGWNEWSEKRFPIVID